MLPCPVVLVEPPMRFIESSAFSTVLFRVFQLEQPSSPDVDCHRLLAKEQGRDKRCVDQGRDRHAAYPDRA